MWTTDATLLIPCEVYSNSSLQTVTPLFLFQDFIELNYIREVTLLSSSSSLNATTNPHSISLPSTIPLEACDCPAPYQGQSCEACARGYARPSGSIADPCVECECNGQTLDCDPSTAVCLNCTGNTIGDHCERCQDGFYGDPTTGIPCLPCECPLSNPENSFSSTCVLNMTDGRSTCDSCQEGYEGRNCELCADGFFGSPMVSVVCTDNSAAGLQDTPPNQANCESCSCGFCSLRLVAAPHVSAMAMLTLPWGQCVTCRPDAA